MIDTLLPKEINKEDVSYKTVEKLAEALNCAKEKNIRNIALTGPYGSGKSSILITLQRDFKEDFEYLPISLATLQANDSELVNDFSAENETKSVDDDSTREEKIESLNRKIEYSILQQLIYREKSETVPYSRFRRIIKINNEKVITYSLCAIACILSFFILFEPDFARVDSLCKLFDFGGFNVIFDGIALLCLLYCLYKFFKYIIRSYSNSRLNKLNLKDGEIELVKDNSIFNKHLDEILYFFQETKYNVVIIEDLDRFGTTNIFLKLRELNQLINESKIVERHITFVYAIKDDVFKDEDRAKFFDYIITVIPFINSSNSKAKLKELLLANGLKEGVINDNDLSEIAFFILDMRILTNIVTEFFQYKEQLSTSSQQLNLTKLLAMIVYKNYHPQDFAKLHRREGRVYGCISNKMALRNEALKTISKQKDELIQNEETFMMNCHLKEIDLRRLFLFHLAAKIGTNVHSLYYNNKQYTYESIANNDKLFQELYTAPSQSIQYLNNRGYNYSFDIDWKTIDNEMGYSSRIKAIKSGINEIESKKKNLHKEEVRIKSKTLMQLINEYDLSKSKVFADFKLKRLEEKFITRGYLDEEYYDYISYFYPGMLTPSDRDLLLAISLKNKKAYDYHIDKIDNFVGELQNYMFENDCILNNSLLNYLAISEDSMHQEFFDQMMNRLKKKDAPLDFLAQYYIYGKQPKVVFEDYINSDKKLTWEQISIWKNEEEKDILIEAYLKYCEEIQDYQIDWLNSNFSNLSNHIDGIGLERCKEIASRCSFMKLGSDSSGLIDYVIEHKLYAINQENLILIVNYLFNAEISADQLNLTHIIATRNNSFIDYVKANITTSIDLLTDREKTESEESLLYIINHREIPDAKVQSHLQGQHTSIQDIENIQEDNKRRLAISLFLVEPTWANVFYTFTEDGENGEVFDAYINHFADTLSNEIVEDENKQGLFEYIFTKDFVSNNSYKQLLKAFTECKFDNLTSLASLTKEKLIILLEDERIPFSQTNVEIMNNTEVLAEYLIHYSKDFISNLEWKYCINGTTLCKLLRSDCFSNEDKSQIFDILNIEIIAENTEAANLALGVLNSIQPKKLKTNMVIALIRQGNNMNSNVFFAKNQIAFTDDHDVIINILDAVGSPYSEIVMTDKQAKIDNTDINNSLLSLLAQKGFISSYKDETNKDGDTFLRVYHKRQN